MSLFDKIKNKRYDLQEKKKYDPSDALRKAIGKQSELDAAKDFKKDVGRNITPELKNTLSKKQDNLNRFFTDKSDSETLKTKSTGDEKQFKSKVKFDSGAKGKFPSGSPDLGGTQRKFVKDRRRKLDTEINKRRSAELTKSDAINRSMGGGSSTEGTGGANQGSTPLKKGKPFSKAESDAIQTRSLNKKTKQFVSKPGTTKSKGSGASTGGQKSLVVNPKSKGTTPVKVNITKPVKQSEVSKKAKKFTADINKANVKVQKNFVGRKAQRIKDATGGKKIGSFSKGNLSFPGDRSGAYQATKSDIEARKGFRGSRTQTGTGKIKTIPGLKADERNPFVKTSVRKGRAAKLGGDIFNQPKFSQKEFDKSFKPIGRNLPDGAKASQIPIIPDPFRGAETTPSKSKGIKLTTPKDVKLPASFGDFEKKLKTYKADVAKTSSKTPRKITKLPPATGTVKGIPQKGTIVKTPVKTPSTPSGTYSMVGTGKKEVVSRKKFVQSVIKSPEYVKAKESKPNPSKFIDQDTGKTFNMADPADKNKYLKQYGKDKFIKQTGGGAGGFGGGSGRGGGGGKSLPGGSGGFGRNFRGKFKTAGIGSKLKNFAKANPLATALAVGAAGYYGYQGIKRAIDGPQLDPRKDFTKTGKIQYGSGSTRDDRDGKKVGDNVRFTYGRKETKNRAKPFLTPDTKKDGVVTKGSISKFRDKVYTVKDKSGKTIDVNKRIQNSAFTKQLKTASTGKSQSAQDFIKKYKKAAEYRGITT